jgi:SET domain-containing protein
MNPYPKRIARNADYIDSLVVAKSQIHGLGCYTKSDIPDDTIVGEYCGERIDSEEASRRNDQACDDYSEYILEADPGIYIDAAKYDGPIRYINHSCSPNCCILTLSRRAFISTIRDIKAGEELTMDYAYDEEVREPCSCRANNCRGYI